MTDRPHVTPSPDPAPSPADPSSPPAAPSPAVDLVDVVKAYGSTRALTGLTLRAEAGQVTAVLGRNGAGKTTAIEICEGLRRADGGQVRVLGLDPTQDGAQLRSRVGVMLQDGGLPTGARVRDVLRLIAAFHPDPVPVAQVLADVALTDQAGASVRRLSGGQYRRLALGVALIGRPELVFLDEPTAGLDPHARRQVWQLIRELRERGASVVLSTHLLDEVEELADRVVLLDAGRVVTTGTPAELTSGASGLRFTARAGLDLSGLRARLSDQLRVTEGTPGSYLVAVSPGVTQSPGAPESAGVTVDAGVVAAVAGWCAEQDVGADGFTVGRRSLEDVFLSLPERP